MGIFTILILYFIKIQDEKIRVVMIFEIEKQTERWNNDLMFVLARTKTNIQSTKEKEKL